MKKKQPFTLIIPQSTHTVIKGVVMKTKRCSWHFGWPVPWWHLSWHQLNFTILSTTGAWIENLPMCSFFSTLLSLCSFFGRLLLSLLWDVALALWTQICVVAGQYDGKSKVENKTMLVGSSFRSRMWLGLTSIKSRGRLQSQSVIFIKALPLRSLSPSATHGKWRRLSWQWFGPLAYSDRLFLPA